MTTIDPPSTRTTLKTVRVLIVEDEYILARNLREGLESLGYQVLSIVDSGEAAIEKAIELRPSIILMDIWIRGELDGIQAAERIWQQLQIPVIYVTGHSDQSTVERATLTSPFGYVLKPVREKELYVAIQTALSRYEREQFFSTVLQGMSDGIIVVDPQLHIKYLNLAAEALMGWKLDEVKERIVTEVAPLLDEQNQRPIDHPIVSVLRMETTIYLENHILLVRKDGTTISIANSVALLKDNDSNITGAVMVFRDDTRRRITEERDLANAEAQQTKVLLAEQQRLNQLKDDFLATTSHELRTPLSNIKLAICMLENVLNQSCMVSLEGTDQAQSIDRYLSILREQAEHELTLVNDLLDIRAIEADAYPLDLTIIPLQNWLPHVAEKFQARIAAQQQTLQIDIPPELPTFISDLNSLTRIVSELLNNACKYTPPGERITVEVSVAPRARAMGQEKAGNLELEIENQKSTITISIKNSGVEIATDQLEKIFQPFYRIPQSDRWKHGGTGLGLALVRKLVEYLQGTIQVTSGQCWTIFTVQLPLNLSNGSELSSMPN